MTLHQLKVFVAVAKFKSFSLAGEELRLHQPSVSIAVRGLERDLEVKLFETFGRKVRLTRAGEEMLRISEEILPKLGGIKERLGEVMGLKNGRIRVGGSAIVAASFLSEAVQTFRKDHPAIDVAIKIERSKILEKQLLDGAIDAAFLGRRPGSPLLVTEVYGEQEIVVIARPNHPLARMRCVPLELIAREPLITHEKGAIIRDMVEARFVEKGFPFRPILELDVEGPARDAIKSAVASGISIGFLSKCHVMPDIASGRLKALKVPELELKRTVFLSIHKNRARSTVVQAFLDSVKRYKKTS